MVKVTIQTKILVLLISMSAIPLIILFLLSTTQVEKRFENKALDQFENSANQLATIINRIIIERIGDADVLAKNKVIASPETTPDEKREELLKVQNAYAIYDDITLVDVNGVVITSTTYNYRGEWLTKKWFLEARQGKSVASDAQIILDPYKIVLVFSAPVFDRNGKVEYVINSQIDMNSLWKITDNFKVDGFGFAYLLNNNNRYIAHPDKKLLFEKTEQELTDCTPGKREYVNSENVDLMEGYAPLLGKEIYGDNGCWKVVVADTREEALGELHALRTEIIGIFLIVLAISVIITQYLSKKVSKPILTLSEEAEHIGKGDFGHRVTVKTGDEIEDLAEKLNQAAEALGRIDKEHLQLEDSKTRFLSIISHELRSPMTAIKGELGLLVKGYRGKLTKEQKEAIDTILRNAKRLDAMIVDMLDVSRIEASRLKFAFVKVDLTQRITELLEELKVLCADKKIKLVPKIHSIPAVETDPDRVMQVLRNLIINAIKFSKEKSEIIVTVEPEDHGISLSVRDFGVGISPENKDKVFEPFYQEQNTIYRKYEGAGLGLTIAKGIVESVGGKIWFKSQKGKGTTFYFTIPARPPKEIKPFNFMVGREKYIEEEVKKMLFENLGPVGELVLSQVSREGLNKNNLVKSFEKLKSKKILDNDKYTKMVNEVEKIFSKYSTEGNNEA